MQDHFGNEILEIGTTCRRGLFTCKIKDRHTNVVSTDERYVFNFIPKTPFEREIYRNRLEIAVATFEKLRRNARRSLRMANLREDESEAYYFHEECLKALRMRDFAKRLLKSRS